MIRRIAAASEHFSMAGGIATRPMPTPFNRPQLGVGA
jgi:hypothetical protein